MVSHCACICLLDDRPKDIVDECDQRRRRSEADRDGAARIALDPELFDELSGLVEQGDVGIPEAVNRLLPIADNEDRRRQGVAGEAEPFTPALHELGDELPLGAARVLELVDEHVAVPGFEAVPALRELVHLLQQPDCPLEHAGKIDERVAVERALVLPQRNREDTPQSAGHDDVQVATERPDGLRDPRRERLRGLTMPPPGVFSVAIGSREAGTHEVLAARLTVLLEEVGAQPIDQPAQRRLSGAARQVAVSARAQADDVAGKHRKLRMADGTVVQEEWDAGTGVGKKAAQPVGGAATGDGRSEIARSVLQISPQRLRGHKTSIEERRDAAPYPPFAKLREQQRHIVIFARHRPADAQRLVERFADEPRHLGFVREVEPGIHVGLERKLTQERQAKRVDR